MELVLNVTLSHDMVCAYWRTLLPIFSLYTLPADVKTRARSRKQAEEGGREEGQLAAHLLDSFCGGACLGCEGGEWIREKIDLRVFLLRLTIIRWNLKRQTLTMRKGI